MVQKKNCFMRVPLDIDVTRARRIKGGTDNIILMLYIFLILPPLCRRVSFSKRFYVFDTEISLQQTHISNS